MMVPDMRGRTWSRLQINRLSTDCWLILIGTFDVLALGVLWLDLREYGEPGTWQ